MYTARTILSVVLLVVGGTKSLSNRGETLDCSSAEKPGSAARQEPTAASADPEQMAKEMMIPNNLLAKELFDMGSRYTAQNRDAEAAAYFWKCSNLNYDRCQTALGLMYQDGRGVTKDLGKAVELVGHGAYAGNRGAQYQVGAWFEDGEVFPFDMQKALHWYMKSAVQGYFMAETRVGLAFELGEGVPRSRQLAVQWLAKAAAQGDDASAEFAGVLSRPNTPRFQDLHELVEYIQRLFRLPWAPPPHNAGLPAENEKERQSRANILKSTDPEAAATCRNDASACS